MYIKKYINLFDGFERGENRWIAMSYLILATLYESQGRLSEAVTLLELLFEQYQHISWEFRADIGMRLAGLYCIQGKLEAKESIYSQLLHESYAHSDADRPYSLSLLQLLANDYYSNGKWPEAEQLYIQIIEVRNQLHGEGNIHSAMALFQLHGILSVSGRDAESDTYLKKCNELFRILLEPENPFRQLVEARCGQLHFDT